MTPPREDRSLVLPEAPGTVPAIGQQEAGLAIASPAGVRALLVEGERVVVFGSEPGSVRIGVDGRAVASLEGIAGGAVANVVASPGLARREWVGAGGVTYETLLACPRLPLFAAQRGGGATPAPESVTLRLAAEGAWRYRVGEDALVAVGPDGDATVLCVHPGPEGLLAEPTGDGELVVRLRPARDGATTVLLSAGAEDGARRALAAAAHLTAHAGLAAAGVEDGLLVETGVAEIDDGVQWARRRLAAAVARADPTDGSVLWAGLAAAAVGDRETAERAYGHAREREPDVAGLLAARISSTFGDARRALEIAGSLLTAEGDGGAPRTDLSSAARQALAASLHNAASPELVGRLRAEVPATESPDSTVEGEGSGTALPMAGRGRDRPSRGRWIGSLLEGAPGWPTPEAPSAEEQRLLDLVARLRAEPTAGWTDWRASLASGLAHGPAGPGTWDAPGSGPVLAPGTSALLLGLACGVLGIAADAHTGRIRVAPALPAHLTRFVAHGVPIASTRLTVRYEREGATHRFVLEPIAAGVPPMAVLEPSVPGVVAAVRVDGADADLEPTAVGERTVVPLQLPVDRIRCLEVTTVEGV